MGLGQKNYTVLIDWIKIQNMKYLKHEAIPEGTIYMNPKDWENIFEFYEPNTVYPSEGRDE